MFAPHVLEEVQQHLIQAQACLAANQLPSAIAALHAAIALMPVLPEPHYYLAVALEKSGQLDPAAAEYRLAMAAAAKQGRGYCEAAMGLGGVLAVSGDRAGARAAYADAVVQAETLAGQNRKSAEAHVILGTALVKSCRYGEALKSFQTALRLDPADRRVQSYAAQTMVEMARFTAASTLCDRILAAEPNNALARTIKGLALLGQGRWREGFDLYRWRWASPDFPSPRLPSDKPVWRGEDVAGKIVIVHWEQGHGDTIQFCRFAAMLGQAGAQVFFLVKPELTRLMQSLPGIARYLDDRSLPPEHDLVCPVMNLAQYFLDANGAIPAMLPYLSAAAPDAARWKEVLAPLPGLKVGLAWQGNPAHVNDALRSIPLGLFQPLAELPGISLVSLQQGVGMDDEGPVLFHPLAFTDFADAAALIENLDLVISVDTAVAHLAGAMGKPVWLLLASPSDWRWGQTGATTSWYPAMRLYRQSKSGDWKHPLAALRADLKKWIERVALP